MVARLRGDGDAVYPDVFLVQSKVSKEKNKWPVSRSVIRLKAITSEFQQMMREPESYGYEIIMNKLEDAWLADVKNNTFIEFMDDEHHRAASEQSIPHQ